MKILHIIPSYLPAVYASGPIRPTHFLNKALVKKGVEVVVYTMNLDKDEKLNVPLEKETDLDGVRVCYFPVNFRPWQYSYKLHRALARNIKNFDLIHITSVFLSVSALGAYYAKKLKKPYIISPHGSLMARPLERGFLKKKIYLSLIEKRNLAGASAVHFVVEKERDEYIRAGLPLRKAVVIPNSLNNSDFNIASSQDHRCCFRKKFGIDKDKKIILFLGRLHPIKGIDTLIPAFAEAVKKESKAVLILAGPDDKNYKKKVIQMIIGHGFNKISSQDQWSYDGKNINIIFAGILLGEDKVAALRDSDAFILPSYTEAFSMATLEAMHFGLPIIITENNGLVFYVRRANAGIVVEKNIQQVSGAILKILNNPEMARKMGESGRRLAKKGFSSEAVAEKFIKEYNEIIT